MAELEAGEGGTKEPPADSEAHAVEGLADEQAERMVGVLADGTTGELQRNFADEIARTGTTSEGMMEAVAESMDMSIEDTTGIINSGLRPQFEAQARAAFAETLGPDTEAVQVAIDHMAQAKPEEALSDS